MFLPDRKEVCVADRENGRIQCFLAETGEFVKEIKKDEFGGKVFAIAFTPAEGELIQQQTSHAPVLLLFLVLISTSFSGVTTFWCFGFNYCFDIV